jgi:glyoxalase family protein
MISAAPRSRFAPPAASATMSYPIVGLHHVTATVDLAQADLDFCVDLLGLRLVKKTVNFDNRHVYHFYYGDERGSPGTLWTTFPYHGRSVRIGTRGTGQVTVTSFSTPAGSLDFWKARLRNRGTAVRDEPPRFGEESIIATDPSGLAIELVATGRDSRAAWSGNGIGPDQAVRGLHSVTMTVQAPEATVALMTDLLGFAKVNEQAGRIRMAVNGDVPGHVIDIVYDAGAPRAANGIGTVHHVALAIAEPDAQVRLRDELIGRGYDVTALMDRQYFRSIYFREPGGVLFEIATMEPGFTADEPLETLGEALKLPPWEEENRGIIEAGLTPVNR